MKLLFSGFAALAGLAAAADPTVTVESVTAGDPWTTLEVRYTLGGVDANADYKVAFAVTAKGVTRAVTNAVAKLTDGTASKTIDVTKLFAPVEADPGAEVAVSLVKCVPKPDGVQLWEDGPYWSFYNIGATDAEEAGYHFWWGDTNGYVRVDDTWQSVDGSVKGYEFIHGNCPTYQKDAETLASEGWVDAEGVLTPEHDAARVYRGDPWRMPTSAEIKSLIERCDWEWTSRNGVYGALVKGRGAYAGKSIFLPKTGFGEAGDLVNPGIGFYWSASLDPTPVWVYMYSWELTVSSGADVRSTVSIDRDFGFAIRPVR